MIINFIVYLVKYTMSIAITMVTGFIIGVKELISQLTRTGTMAIKYVGSFLTQSTHSFAACSTCDCAPSM